MAKRGRKPKTKLRFEEFGGMSRSIFALLLLVFGVISLLAIISGYTQSSGKLNSVLRTQLVEGFGLASILFPIIVIYASLIIIGTLKFELFKHKYLIGLVIIYICILGILGTYAGQIGGLIQNSTGSLISNPGAVIFYIVALLITLVVLSKKGIDEWIHGIFSFIHKIISKVTALSFPQKEQELLEGENLLSGPISNEPTEQLKRDFNSQLNMQQGTTASSDMSSQLAQSSQSISSEFISPDVNTNNFAYANSGLNAKKDLEIISPPNSPILDEETDLTQKQSGEIGDQQSQQQGLQDEDESTKPLIIKERISGVPLTNRMWEYPPMSLLSTIPNQAANAGDVNERAHKIEETLFSFGIKAQVKDANIGPAVTQYAISIPQGSKANKISSLATDIALRIKSPTGSVRIEAPIPGSDLIGIEVPNYSPSTVSLRSVLDSQIMKAAKGKLTVAVGLDVSGKAVVEDMTRWPHALIAGSTGSGKSVMINAIITSLLYRCSPQEVKFIMIDPKMVELIQYKDIPHLLTPVITDVEQKAVSALAWAVSEMERRYKAFSSIGVRDIASYNSKSGFQAEPYIVIVVDELADMMMVASSDVERYITRLAQKARATGIHLVLSTQRPSVNVLTGTIKANIPTRLAFKVTSNVDSRVIIDQSGAETLIGKGDMLFVPPTDSKPKRIQGVYVSDNEISALADYLRNTGVEPDYQEEIVEQKVGSLSSFSSNSSAEGLDDPKMVDALQIAISEGKASASYFQRRIGLGYSRAARMVDDMEAAGIIGPQNGSKPREVFVSSVDEAIQKIKSRYSER